VSGTCCIARMPEDKVIAPEAEPLFKAPILIGRGGRVWFYNGYFVLMGWRKGTRFDYSQIAKIEETLRTWRPGITKLSGWVYLADGRKPFCVVLAPQGYVSLGSQKLNKQIAMGLPLWLEQKLGKERYIKMTEQSLQTKKN
jgi:hypothetical protein